MEVVFKTGILVIWDLRYTMDTHGFKCWQSVFPVLVVIMTVESFVNYAMDGK